MIFFLTCLIFRISSFTLGLNNTEKLITKSLVEHLLIKNCILVNNTNDKLSLFHDFKTMSDWGISTTVKSQDEVFQYVRFDLDPVIHSGSVGTDAGTWELTKKLLMPKTMVLFQNPDLNFIERLFFYVVMGQTSPYFTWIIFTEKPIDKSIDLNVPYNAELIFIQKINLTYYKLTEVYVAKLLGETFQIDYGSWDLKNGLVTSNLSFYERRIDLKQTLITVENHWRAIFFRDDIVQGYHWKIVEDIAKMTNISLEIVYEDRFATISGLFFVMEADIYVHDQVGPIFEIDSCIYIKQPNVSVKADYFLLPFDNNLWYSLLSSVIVIGIAAIFIHHKLRPYMTQTNNTFIDSGLMPLEALCNQCGSTEPENLSGKIIIFVYGFLTVVLMAAYSGELCTYLLLREAQPPFEDLEGLIKDESFSKGVKGDGMEYFYIYAEATDKHFYKSANDSLELFEDTKKAIHRVCQENFACITGKHVISNLTVHCDLYPIKNKVLRSFSSIRFKESSYGIKEAFSYKLHWFYSSGIIHKMKGELNRAKPVNYADYLPVEMEHLSYILAIIAVGILLSFVFLLLEIIKKQLE